MGKTWAAADEVVLLEEVEDEVEEEVVGRRPARSVEHWSMRCRSAAAPVYRMAQWRSAARRSWRWKQRSPLFVAPPPTTSSTAAPSLQHPRE
jgi:hypothetical protein